MPVEMCAFPACGQPLEKRGWCGAHYQQWRKTGTVKPVRYRRSQPKICTVCGVRDWPDNGRRRQCSGACQQMASRWRRAGGERPTSVSCALCDRAIDLLRRGPSGRLRRADTALCSVCRGRRALRHKTSVRVIARRDGTDCRLCGTAVDMALAHPHPMSPSIDHVVPRATGGSDDPANLQLAHLHCNQVKNRFLTHQGEGR